MPRGGARKGHGNFNHDDNSVAVKINTGDKEFLAKIGMTKAEAKAKMKAALKQARSDNAQMELWYRREVMDIANTAGGD